MMHVVVDQENRNKMLKWLNKNTSISFESGVPCWPQYDISKIKKNSLIVAKRHGISVVFCREVVPEKHGKNVTLKDFCRKIRNKFPVNVVGEKKKHEQVKLGV